MRRYVSREMGLNVKAHSEIDFVDIVINGDTKLFLDPCLIELCEDRWALSARATMESYFKRFYEIYRNNEGIESKRQLFAHPHEINATKLGHGKGDNGKAKTTEGMIEAFNGVESLFSKKIKLSHPIDLPLFIKGFAEDCLSDMLTNVLFKVLNDFTLDQCEKHNVHISQVPEEYYYWDYLTNDWMPYKGNCLIVDSKVILLVPKWFVRKNFYYNVRQYFSRIILEKLQQEQAWTDKKGKVKFPSKKSLRDKIIYGDRSQYLTVIEYTEREPALLDLYHKRIPQFYVDKGMNDEMLDRFLYRAHKKQAS